VTFAPRDLLAIQQYAHDKTGQDFDSLGIIHANPEGGGYHEGQDLLILQGTAPGPQFPGTDYSYGDAPGRDLAPDGTLAGGDAASAFDFGDGFDKFLEFNAWMRERMLANDSRTRDIRSMIYTLDRATVRRIDRTSKQSDSGESTHLTHTHFSFFRDSLGRRDKEDNFLGLLKEFFEGSVEEDDMPFATAPEELPTGKNVVKSYSIPPVNSGGLPWGNAFLSVWADLFGGRAAFRLAVGDGNSFNVIGDRITLESGKLFNVPLGTGVRGLSFTRLPANDNDPCTASISFSVEYGRR